MPKSRVGRNRSWNCLFNILSHPSEAENLEVLSLNYQYPLPPFSRANELLIAAVLTGISPHYPTIAMTKAGERVIIDFWKSVKLYH